METWQDVYNSIANSVRSSGSDLLFFRGHSNADWKLLPSLARMEGGKSSDLEAICFFDFVTRAGVLLPEETSSWNVAFSMQHHGLPTRLLDWSESFSIALYFALKGAVGDCCVWMLDPFKLNEKSAGSGLLWNPTDLRGDYKRYFIESENKLEGDVIAISPLRHHPRISSQRAGFTLHSDIVTPLEELYPNSLTKFVIPQSAQEGAIEFLKLAGISEFILFPDLDGLSRELAMQHYRTEI